MINKVYRFFISFIMLLVFLVIQPAFAGFEITIVNKSGLEYKNIGLVITAVGFNAMYGRIKLKEINSGSEPQYFSIKNEFLKVPLTKTPLPSLLVECNLDVFVVAAPKKISEPIIEKQFKNILVGVTPKVITEDPPYKYPSKPMKGIQPPDLIITINEDGSIGDQCVQLQVANY